MSSYVLPDYLENLSFSGFGSTGFTGAGNSLANVIRGGNAADLLSGGAGDDQLFGLSGIDVLDGGTGDDVMAGGTGNDIYYVDSTGDHTSEVDGGGTDTVYATVSFALSNDIETLILTGLASSNGYDNALANRIVGNDGHNSLAGMEGADTLQGGLGNDVLDGGTGIDMMNGGLGDDIYYVDASGDVITESGGGGVDLVITSLSSYSLSSSLENLVFSGSGPFKGSGNDMANRITGGPGNDVLNGFDGADILSGGAGTDSMTGGLGDDIYYVDDANDSIVEYGSGGSDTVRTTLSTYSVPKNVERVEFIGAGSFRATGGTAAETLMGGAGADTLDGSSGNDVLIGGSGDDVLIGGSGTDTAYVFASLQSHLLIRNGTNITLRDLTGSDGTDTLSSIEWLVFSEGQFSATGNNAPLASADSFTVTSGKASILDLLANDWDLESGRSGLVVTILSSPAHGSIKIGNDGTATYIGDADYAGPDSLTYRLSDGVLTSVATAQITVQAALNHLLVFTSPSKLNVDENRQQVLTLTAMDEDASDTLIYTIAGGTDAALFRLVGGNSLEFVTAPDFETRQNLPYDVAVAVSDGHQQVLQSLAISLNDLNDTAPILSLPQRTSVFENEALVLALNATDADGTHDPITLSVKADGADSSLFRILGNELQFILPRDFESQHGPYVVTIVAQDGLNSSEVDLTIDIVDVNDSAPTFSGPDHYVLAENKKIVADLNVSDPDSTGEKLELSIKQDGDGTLFELIGNRLQFKGPADFEAQHSPTYVLTVMASDGVHSTEQMLTIEVTDVDENSNRPPDDIQLSNTQISEDALVGSVIGSLSAVDPDAGDEGSFQLLDDAGGLFRLVGEGLVLARPLDFEAAASHPITISVTDAAGHSIARAFSITVVDVNDNRPVLMTGSHFTVSENSRAVVELKANDPDLTGEPITFRIKPGSGDASLFTLAGNDLQFIEPVDFESAHGPEYSVTVIASDGTNFVEQPLAVTITDSNDSPPVLTSASALTIAENQTHVVDLTAHDPDQVGGPVSFSIAGNIGDADRFRLDGATLAFTSAPDFENGDHGPYTVTIIASDGVQSSAQMLTIAVSDVVAGDRISGTANDDRFVIPAQPGYDRVDGLSGADRLEATGSALIWAQADAFALDFGRDGSIDLIGADIEYLSLTGSLLSFGASMSSTALSRGSVTFIGSEGSDLLDGSLGAVAVTVNGLSGADVLRGGAASDTIDGGAGDDQMSGGGGDDAYVVDSNADVVMESPGEGIDTVRTALVVYGLSANVENLVYTGSISFSGSGNALANSLMGGIGADRLDGLGGADLMAGGLGDDNYLVDNSNDMIIENAGEGSDSVTASSSFALATNVEKLTLTGKLNLSGTGNGLGNTMTGNGADNVLNGLSGDDALYGGSGNDLLIGGWGSDVMTGNAGSDLFLFDVMEVKSNKDTIKDFEHGIDHIEFSKLAFAALSEVAGSALSPTAFVLGSAATQASHRIIYNQGTGALYYDPDGTGSASMLQVAALPSKPALDAGDILIV